MIVALTICRTGVYRRRHGCCWMLLLWLLLPLFLIGKAVYYSNITHFLQTLVLFITTTSLLGINVIELNFTKC